jgi:hypothetical protein
VVAAHLKKYGPLNRKTSSSDISIYHMDFHEGHSTVGEWQGSGRVVAWEWHGMCESGFKTAGEWHGMCESGFKTAGEWHGMCKSGFKTAGERHGMCESTFNCANFTS